MTSPANRSAQNVSKASLISGAALLTFTSLVASASVFLVGCAPDATSRMDAPKPALTVRVRAADGEHFAAVGTVRSLGVHEVATETGGRVVRLYVNVGDQVRQGQILAELDPEPLRLEAARAAAGAQAAKVGLDGARREVRRLEALVAAGAAPQRDLDQARTAASEAEQQDRGASAQAAQAARLARTAVIRAPADGVIATRHVELSAVLAAGAPMFALESGNRREILADVAVFRYGNGSGSARLVGVSSQAAGVDARMARFAILDGAPPSGAAVELRLAGGAVNADAVTAPLSALVAARSGERRVLRLDDRNRLSAVPVTLIAVTPDGARIRGPLVPGQRIVADGAELLRVGQTVRPIPFTS
jgi:membrane fusion protein, multidrug efflux system